MHSMSFGYLRRIRKYTCRLQHAFVFIDEWPLHKKSDRELRTNSSRTALVEARSRVAAPSPQATHPPHAAARASTALRSGCTSSSLRRLGAVPSAAPCRSAQCSSVKIAQTRLQWIPAAPRR
jgi:hypothetical protein